MILNFKVTKKTYQGSMLDKYSPFKNYVNSDGELDLLRTNKLNFSLNHPVDIQCQRSYDNSVNLILNDGNSQPKLINSRFIASNNQYKEADRTGSADSNLYRDSAFYSDTALFKIFKSYIKVNLQGIHNGGNLKVGNYTFYFKYVDDDNNETNIAGWSKRCPVFIGENSKIDGGYCNKNSNKYIELQLTNLDTTYQYLNVYYTRDSSDQFELNATTCFKINQKFSFSDSTKRLIITGNENTIDYTVEALNLNNQILNSVETQAMCSNTLLLGNVQQHSVEYEDLKDLSLRIYPTFEPIINNTNYSDVNNIYNFTGYFPGEFYSFGIVYIYNNNKESPVFPIRGNVRQGASVPTIEDIYDSENNRNYLTIDSDNYRILPEGMDNSKGVSRVPSDYNVPYSVIINFPENKNFQEILSQQNIQSYYIVRQKRIPTVLTQMYVLPTNENIGLPLVPNSKTNYKVPDFKQVLDSDGNEQDLILDEENISKNYACGISPDFTVRQPYYNNIITGDDFKVKIVGNGNINFSEDGDNYKQFRVNTQNLDYKVSNHWVRIDSSFTINPYNTTDTQTFENLKVYVRYHGSIDSKIDIKVNELVNDYIINCSLTLYQKGYFAYNSQGGTYTKTYTEICNIPSINLAGMIISPDYSKLQKVNSDKEITSNLYTIQLQTVKEDVPNVKLGDLKFHSKAGSAEDLKKFLYNLKNKEELLKHWDDYQCTDNNAARKVNSTDIQNLTKRPAVIRGSYSPYIAIKGDDISDLIGKIIQVYVPGYDENNIENFLKIRYADTSYYSSISDVESISDYLGKSLICYQGDCYDCSFTQRIYKNFQDPVAPNNDSLVKQISYCAVHNKGNIGANMDNPVEDSKAEMVLTGFDNINRGDINAIKLGTWITVPVLSVNNLNIRSVDDTYASEQALTGNTRAFYPYRDIDLSGNNKIPESQFINEGFSQSLGYLKKFAYQSVPAIKNDFRNRVYYSNIAVQDSYQNGFRIFSETAFRDYKVEYGTITKLIEYNGALVIVFEHAIGIVNIGASKDTEQDYLNTANRLPEDITVISDSYGSSFRDSIIKTPSGIYGVDTTAKKIWRYNGDFRIISEQLVDSFLLKNIKDDINITIGVSNCKTIYNAQKHKIMFTFYTPKNNIDEISWNLCWDEMIQKWQTFYSWIPLHGVNIYNNFISFDRELSRNTIKYVLSDVLCDNNVISDKDLQVLSLFEDYKKGEIELIDSTFGTDCCKFGYIKGGDLVKSHYYLTIYTSKILSKLAKLGYIDITFSIKGEYKTYTLWYSNSIPEFTNYFYIHSSNQLYNYQEKILPTYWYNKQHPFEFEFIISKDLPIHKIFNKMAIIGNNSEPESFHYEITGDCFDFAELKPEIYFRQEATRAFYHKNGSNISWDESIESDETLQNGSKLWNISRKNTKTNSLGYFTYKSTQFPTIYNYKSDYLNTIEDYYTQVTSNSKNYSNLAGAEIVKNNNEYHITNHAKGVDMKKDGRLRGNMYYQEDRWFVQINPITIVQKNELASKWAKKDNRYFPALVVGNGLPSDLLTYTINNDSIPEFLKTNFNYSISNIDTTDWGIYPTNVNGTIIYADAHTRQEIKVKDKYMKVKIRYSGTKPVSIQNILTYYTEVN